MKSARLVPFLLLSAFVHAVMLATLPAGKGGAFSDKVLHIALMPPQEAPRTSALPEPAPVRIQKQEPIPLTERPTKVRQARADGPKLISSPNTPPLPEQTRRPENSPATDTSTEPVTESTHNTSEPSTQDARARILAKARSAMARYFTYPHLARHRGWEGEVLLGFSVLPDGRIDNVQIVQSSGHRLLDEAARSSLVHVEVLHDEQPHGMLRLLMPVIYRLAEG